MKTLIALTLVLTSIAKREIDRSVVFENSVKSLDNPSDLDIELEPVAYYYSSIC